MHWDVDTDPNALITYGAALLRTPIEDAKWWVLADPAGNEFCAFLRRRRRCAGRAG